MSFDGTDERIEGNAEERFDQAGPEDVDAPAADDLPEIEEGRYLYCIVAVGEYADGESDTALETTGVDDEPVSVIVADGVGAVVHACDGLYDSADLAQVRRWLVRHQTVVDEAGQAFGTPIPFQFDTILRGDDDGVREWLRAEHDTLSHALEALADHWEYRVEVVEIDPPDDETLIEHHDALGDLATRIDEADEGTGHLLEKRLDQQLTDLRAARRESVAADLEARLADVTREVHALERSPTASLSDAVDEGDEAGETICRFTLLAHEDDEATVGSILDDVASTDGLEVRFTGPWPPYTVAPELGGEDAPSTEEP